MSTTDVAWAAGIIEASGRFQIFRNKNERLHLTLTVQRRDTEILDRLVEVLGVGHVNGPYVSKNTPEHYKYIVFSLEGIESLFNEIKYYLSPRKSREIAEIIAKRRDASRYKI